MGKLLYIRFSLTALRLPSEKGDCDQYWSAIGPVLVTNRKQYWSPREVVLVERVTSTGRFLLLLRGCLTAPFFEDEVEGFESCGGRWLGGLLGRGTLLIYRAGAGKRLKKRTFAYIRNNDAMTQAEDQELQRLQVNIRRLAGIVAEQNEKLAQLRMLLQQRDEALLAMQEELKSVRRHEATLATASALVSPDMGDVSRRDARELLDGIISQLDRCISQLTSEPEATAAPEPEI